MAANTMNFKATLLDITPMKPNWEESLRAYLELPPQETALLHEVNEKHSGEINDIRSQFHTASAACEFTLFMQEGPALETHWTEIQD